MIASLLGGIAAKLGAAGVAAKAGVAMAVAAASVSGAAAAGVLPGVADPPSGPPAEVVTTSAPSEPESSTAEAEGSVDSPNEDPDAAGDAFGTWVSEDASDPGDPGVNGSVVSAQARTLGAQHRPAGAGRPDAAGQQGIDRTAGTPAADHLPESVPGGSSTAEQYRPEVPVAGQPETTGAPEGTLATGAPEEIPAGGAPEEIPVAAPESVPAGFPAGTPVGRP